MQPGQPLTDYHHIDPSQLLDAVGGDAGTVASLARTFLESAPPIFARLEEAAAADRAVGPAQEAAPARDRRPVGVVVQVRHDFLVADHQPKLRDLLGVVGV